jgi:hypothetical protein
MVKPKSKIGPGRLYESHQSEKKIENEERKERLRKVLEKRLAKSIDPKDIPNNAENENEASANSKK